MGGHQVSDGNQVPRITVLEIALLLLVGGLFGYLILGPLTT